MHLSLLSLVQGGRAGLLTQSLCRTCCIWWARTLLSGFLLSTHILWLALTFSQTQGWRLSPPSLKQTRKPITLSLKGKSELQSCEVLRSRTQSLKPKTKTTATKTKNKTKKKTKRARVSHNTAALGKLTSLATCLKYRKSFQQPFWWFILWWGNGLYFWNVLLASGLQLVHTIWKDNFRASVGEY